jgi:hypothetical protein
VKVARWMNPNMATASSRGLGPAASPGSGARVADLDLRTAAVPAVRGALRVFLLGLECSLDLAFGRFAFVAISANADLATVFHLRRLVTSRQRTAGLLCPTVRPLAASTGPSLRRAIANVELTCSQSLVSDVCRKEVG